MYDKQAEFTAWLIEERKLNPETLSKDLTKKEFARFVEDYNTGEFARVFRSSVLELRPSATLPHDKYYNMDIYDRRMALLRNGETLPLSNDSYDPNADFAAHQSAHKRAPTSNDTYMSKEQLAELRRVQNERGQVRL